jgi:hypothetical protein
MRPAKSVRLWTILAHRAIAQSARDCTRLHTSTYGMGLAIAYRGNYASRYKKVIYTMRTELHNPTHNGLTVHDFTKMAIGMGLANPLGRAAYAMNRAINAGCGAGLAFAGIVPTTPATFLQKCKDTTAQRWLAHFLAGGSLRALRYKNHARYNRARRLNYR